MFFLYFVLSFSVFFFFFFEGNCRNLRIVRENTDMFDFVLKFLISRVNIEGTNIKLRDSFLDASFLALFGILHHFKNWNSFLLFFNSKFYLYKICKYKKSCLKNCKIHLITLSFLTIFLQEEDEEISSRR